MTDPTPEQLDKDIEWYNGKPNVATYESLYKEYQRTLEKLELAKNVINEMSTSCSWYPLLTEIYYKYQQALEKL